MSLKALSNKKYIVLSQTEDPSKPTTITLKVFDIEEKVYKTLYVPIVYFK